MNTNNPFEFPDAVVAVFAKEPQLGLVKTRLQPLLGAQGALALHEELIRYVTGGLQQACVCPVELWVAGASPGKNKSNSKPHELFLSFCNIKDIYDQSGVDLGARMQHAAVQVLARAKYVVLVGADCPAVDAAYLRDALSVLQSGVPVVVGPADDGGYVLLGLRDTVPAFLFTDMPWGSDKVLDATRNSLRLHNARWVELEARWDVDRPEDLQRLTTLSPPFVIPVGK